MSTEGKVSPEVYCYSLDNEEYHELGKFTSAREAALQFFKDNLRDDVVWIGQDEDPPAAEGFIDADLVIEHVQVQDEYSGEYADNWPGETKEQRDQLTDRLQKVFGDWLDEHGLRPDFSLVHENTKFSRSDFPELPPPFSRGNPPVKDSLTAQPEDEG